MILLYAVQGKVKAVIGDVLSFSYKNYKEDKTPSVVYLTTMQKDNGEYLVSGFNLNFLKKLSEQEQLVNTVRRFKNPKRAYQAVATNPRWAKCYRVYSEMFMVRVMKYDLNKKILIPMSKPDTSNPRDVRNQYKNKK